MVAENALAFSNSDPVKFVRSALSAMKEGKSQQFDIILSDIRGFKRSSTKSQMAASCPFLRYFYSHTIFFLKECFIWKWFGILMVVFCIFSFLILSMIPRFLVYP
jgi:hypothetical protein